MRVRAVGLPAVAGHVSAGFESVREAFVDNLIHRHELGGACCAYYHGEKVVDLWGGIRNKQTGEPWLRDTMVVVHSATKGLAAMTIALAHSRGWLDFEACVSAYWPEFAQQGKEGITVRQLLAHQAGLFAIDEPVDRETVADLDRLAVVLARQKPVWEPGTRQAYHALTLGFYEGELLRRVDPQHRSLGQFFYEEIASPLELDVYLRLPEDIPNSRLATLAPPGRMQMLFGFPLRLVVDAMNPRSHIYRALEINPGRRGLCGPGAHLRAKPRGPVRQWRRHGSGHRPRVRRVRYGRPRAGVTSENARPVSRPGDRTRHAGSMTSV